MTKSKASVILTALFIFTSISDSYSAGLLFRPLTANVFEPRIGTMYQFDDNKLRLDIGTSIDLLELQKTDESQINIGTDFFTFSRLRSEGNMKFPVETSDYFFGINITGKTKLWDKEISGRLRLSHISSHLVDGMANGTEFTQKPFVYSREFMELVGTITISGIRFYTGLSYVFSTIPKEVNQLIPQFGADYEYGISSIMSLRAGYDFKLGGNDCTFRAVHTLQAGVLIKAFDTAGIMLNYYLYKGPSMHGMFYREYDSYQGIGFQIGFY